MLKSGMRWTEHVAHMRARRGVRKREGETHRIFIGKHEGIRLPGTPMHR
jgi:hypothetical protein